MADFQIALERTLKFEGSYSNDTHDPGGETFCGISRKAWPEWEGWKTVDKHQTDGTIYKLLDATDFVKTVVSDFYRDNFWEKIHGDEIESQEIANALFDFAVNSGVPTAVKALQYAVNECFSDDLEIDGVLGNETRERFFYWQGLYGEDSDRMIHPVRSYRLIHICRWVAAKPERHKFLLGLSERAVKA